MIRLSAFKDEIKEMFLFHIPHSSIQIPDKSTFICEDKMETQINLLTDWETEKIFNVDGIDRIVCEWSRVFCDVERFIKDDLEEVGYGLYYTQTDSGETFRNLNGKQKVIDEYYLPYHKNLSEKAKKKEDEYGVCYLVDCHSFPDVPFMREKNNSVRPDICIGVNEENSFLEDLCVRFFRNEGFEVEVNKPFKGAIVPLSCFKTKSVMIEINRKLYMEDNKIIPGKVIYLNKLINKLFNFGEN